MVELSDLQWDEQGLMSVVIQDVQTGAVLRLAEMNADALACTRCTGEVYLWGSEQGKVARVGEDPRGGLHVVDILVDCDSDALLLWVNPAGPACGSGEWSCFFRRLSSPRALSAIAWSREAAEGQ